MPSLSSKTSLSRISLQLSSTLFIGSFNTALNKSFVISSFPVNPENTLKSIVIF